MRTGVRVICLGVWICDEGKENFGSLKLGNILTSLTTVRS